MIGDSTPSSGFCLISPAFSEGASIPVQYTCKGQNISPPLNIINVPKGAKSLALVLHDPDAVGSDFTHWVVWNIPANIETVAANSVPLDAILGKNSAGENKYMGPCPPVGTGVHRYKFELYALGQPISLDRNSGRSDFQKVIEPHVIDKYALTGLFEA